MSTYLNRLVRAMRDPIRPILASTILVVCPGCILLAPFIGDHGGPGPMKTLAPQPVKTIATAESVASPGSAHDPISVAPGVEILERYAISNWGWCIIGLGLKNTTDSDLLLDVRKCTFCVLRAAKQPASHHTRELPRPGEKETFKNLVRLSYFEQQDGTRGNEVVLFQRAPLTGNPQTAVDVLPDAPLAVTLSPGRPLSIGIHYDAPFCKELEFEMVLEKTGSKEEFRYILPFRR